MEISIASKRAFLDLKNYFEEELSSTLGLDSFNIYNENHGEWNLLRFLFNIEIKLEEKYGVILNLAQTITDYILIELKEYLIKDVIKQSYFYFSPQEREKVFTYCIQRDSEDDIYETRRKVLEKLSNHLYSNKHLNLEGFIYFRLKFFLNELKKIVDDAVDDFLMEKEYQEFIKLLKYFVELQEPKVVEAHVLIDGKGNFQIRDNNLKVIEHKYIEDMNIAFFKDDVDSEDLLVSALVTAAPGKIVIHQKVYTQSPRVTDTLQSIFEEKVVLCKKCKYCSRQTKLSIYND